jgi:hypothetical protein
MNRTAVGLSRPSTTYHNATRKDVDARVKPAHDESICYSAATFAGAASIGT